MPHALFWLFVGATDVLPLWLAKPVAAVVVYSCLLACMKSHGLWGLLFLVSALHAFWLQQWSKQS
jgi:hypothetical protein